VEVAAVVVVDVEEDVNVAQIYAIISSVYHGRKQERSYQWPLFVVHLEQF
jgi:hypothetical protein